MRKWLPIVDSVRCTGCGRCVEICGLRLRQLVAGVAKLVDPAPCPGEELCVIACRHAALSMDWVDVADDDSSSR